jgi:DNA modification methylase
MAAFGCYQRLRIHGLSNFKVQRVNANRHTQKGLRELENSIQRDGWIGAQTAAADQEIFDGSARLEVAEDKFDGVEPIIVESDGTRPVIVVRTDIPNADDPKAKRLAIGANAIAKIDLDFDPTILAALANEDPAIANLLKQDQDFSKLLQEPKEETADAGELVDRAAELQEKWQVQRGDVWQIGRHKLMCGDSTSAEDVGRLTDGEQVALTFTSPPYNAGKTPTEAKMGTESKYAGDADNRSAQEYLTLISEATARALSASRFAVFNLQMLSGNKSALIDYLYTFKGHIADIAIWDKQRAQPAMAENVLNSQFEFLFIFSAKQDPSRAIGTQRFRGTVSNVYSAPPQSGNEMAKTHSATFPAHLPTWAITHFTAHDENVLDLFNGSGTTLVACEQTGRIGRGMEIEPKYCAVTLERLSLLGLNCERVNA